MYQRSDWLSKTLMAVLEQQQYPVAAADLAAMLELSESEAGRGAERLVIEERVMAVRIDGVIHFTLPGRPIRPPPRRAVTASPTELQREQRASRRATLCCAALRCGAIFALAPNFGHPSR